ncbi:MAG: HAD-IC family P-type ATPase, partial [Oscillospiraceae bacterium]|nr:HAD-IC family P-type ATPase [Oscillospiraceae bacterium]
MEREQKELLSRIIVAALLIGVLHFLPVGGWVQFLLYLIPYLIVGFGTLKEAAEGIAHGEVFDENFLMTVATLGAFALGDYAEACFVMLFFAVGELFEDLATDRSRRSVSSLVDLRPDTANVERDGEVLAVSPETVAVDEVIVIKPGEKIPLDGVILSGATSLNTAVLTGEALPRDVSEGDTVLSGCVNLSAVIRVRVTKTYQDSTVARILDMMEHCAEGKAKSERFITRFARWYTPVVVCAALVIALVPPLFTGAWDLWPKRALSFLIISCPCALVVSVPLAFFAGIGGASRKG